MYFVGLTVLALSFLTRSPPPASDASIHHFRSAVCRRGGPTRCGGQTTEPSTRAEALQQQREEKQRSLTPNRPDNLQRGMDLAEDRALLILTRENLYPKIGTLTTGSGFAFGVALTVICSSDAGESSCGQRPV